MQLILASTSKYRRELLQRLRIPFECVSPQIDEARLDGEAPTDMAARLARAKASAVAATYRQACVIGSDQVAELDGQPLGKPGDRDGAIAQLTAMSGRSIQFHTALAVIAPSAMASACDRTRVRMRALDLGQIERYIDAEPAFDCAGSFKSEGFGIVLFEAIDSGDPTALVGLPLIATARLLRDAGYALP